MDRHDRTAADPTGRLPDAPALLLALALPLAALALPLAAAGQAPAAGTLAPVGPPAAPPVRVDAGGACIVDLAQAYAIAGTLEGRLEVDYRIRVAGPCGEAAGTYAEEWIAHGAFRGTVDGEPAAATLVYTARVEAGGAVRGRIVLGDGVAGELEVTGEMADGRLSYDGAVEVGG